METEALHKKKLIAPKLRFKEFTEGWENRSMGDLGSFMGGGTPTTSVEKYWIGDIPWISSSDLFEDDLHNINVHRYLNKEAISESATKVIPKHSVLLISRVGVGKLAINKTELCTSQDFNNFIPNRCNSYFIGYFLLARKNLLINFAQGTSIKGFTTSDIKSLKVSIPTTPEQQKIASFLSAVDERIQHLARKKEFLEQYKKGVMQQLFSGKLRFKDVNGKGFPNWKEKRLGDFVLSYKGGAPLTPSDFTKLPGSEVIPKKGITAGGQLIIDNETPTYCKLAFYEAYSKCVIDNSYLVTTLRDLVPSGPSIGYIVQYNSTNKYILAQGVYGLKIDESKLNREWLIQYSNTVEYRKIMQTIMVGSTQVHIRNEEFFKVKLNLPSFAEQRLIANYLTYIDSKINIVNKQITQTQTFKKGLLQQMFV